MWPHGCCYTYSLFQNTYCLLTYTSKLRISSRICRFFSFLSKNLLLITSQKSNFGFKHLILSFAAAQHVWKYGCLPHTNHMTPLWHQVRPPNRLSKCTSVQHLASSTTLHSPPPHTSPSLSPYEHIILLKNNTQRHGTWKCRIQSGMRRRFWR